MYRTSLFTLPVLAVGLLASAASAAELTSQQQMQILQEASAAYDLGLRSSGTDVAAAKDAFSVAARKYELLVESGINNARLYENLGNARLHSGRLGAAIAAYEHAAAQAPADRSIRQHLDHARSLRNGAADSGASISLGEQFARWNQSVPAWQRLAVAVIAWTLLWGCLLGRLIWRKSYLSRIATASALVAGLLVCSLGVDWANAPDGVYGIVTSPTIIRAHNGETFQPVDSQPLSEGTRFDVLSRRGDWLQIHLADGENGWITANCCDVITPPSTLWN